MSENLTARRAGSNLTLDPKGESFRFVKHLQPVIRFDLSKPVSDWFGGNLSMMDFETVVVQLQNLRADGCLSVEWLSPLNGQTVNCLMTVGDGTLKSAKLQMSDSPAIIEGTAAIKKLLKETYVEKSNGTFFFEPVASDVVTAQPADPYFPLRAIDLCWLLHETEREMDSLTKHRKEEIPE